MNIIEKTIRQFHESWDLRDPDRGEAQIGTDGYRMDYHRWRAAFPDGEVKVVNVITSGDELDGWAVVDFLNRSTQTGPFYSSLGKFLPTGRRMDVPSLNTSTASTTRAVGIQHWAGKAPWPSNEGPLNMST